MRSTSFRSSNGALRLALALLGISSVAAVAPAAVTNFTFDPATSITYAPLTGATRLPMAEADEASISGVPIGFDFYFEGTRYQHVTVSSNGFIALTPGTASLSGNALSTGAPTTAIIAPLWDDLNLIRGEVSHKTEGTIGSRTFTVEWKNALWNFSAGAPAISFQARLFEATGEIQFDYDQDAGYAAPTAGSASVGLSSGITATNFLSANGLTNAATVSSVTETTTVSAAPAGDLRFRFTPTVSSLVGPTAGVTTGISGTGMTLNWTNNDSAPNLLATEVYRSDDGGATFQYFTSVGPAVNTLAITNLGWNSDYQWRLVAAGDSVAAAPVTITASTLAGTSPTTVTVGPSGTHATLGAAFTAIGAVGLAGPTTIEFTSGYAEVLAAPLAMPTYAGPDTPITIRPAAGALGTSITGTASANLLDFNEASYITIDGRPGGTGTTFPPTADNLRISSSFATASNDNGTIVMRNGSRFNTIRYATIESSNPSGFSGGVAIFQTNPATSMPAQNDVVEFCFLRQATTQPAALLYVSSTQFASVAFATRRIDQYAKGIRFSNNWLANVQLNAAAHGVIRVGGNANEFTVENNSIFQQAARTYTGTTDINGIRFFGGSGGNHVISGNTIGTNPSGVGPVSWQTTGAAAATRAQGFFISSSSAMPITVQNNTVADFTITSTSTGSTTAGVLTGLFLQGNGRTIISGNTFGNMTTAGSLSALASTTGGANFIVSGIIGNSYGDVTISNNNIGGLLARTTTVTGAATSAGILAWNVLTFDTNARWTVTNNTIGGTNADSIQAGDSTATTGTNLTFGIRFELGSNDSPVVQDATGLLIASGNTIRNLVTNMTAAAAAGGGRTNGIVVGINASTAIRPRATLTNNTIGPLTSFANAIGSDNTAAAVGINLLGSTHGHTVSGNTISGVACTPSAPNQTAAARVIGINANTPAFLAGQPENLISANRVYGLNNATTNVASALTGINNHGGAANFYNNMVRVGLDAAGGDIAASTLEINGLRDAGTGSNNAWVHNSVRVSGAATGAGTTNTWAYRRTTAIAGAGHSVANNILFNGRSNSGPTGTHAATGFNTVANVNAFGNLLFAPGTGGAVGGLGASPTFSADVSSWQTALAGATIAEVGSLTGQPFFVGDNTVVPDLHLGSCDSAANNAAGFIAGVATDADGDTRTAPTVDIGADEATIAGVPPAAQPTAFVGVSVDCTELNVSFTAASGPPSGYLVIRKLGSAETATPVDGTNYSVGDTLGTGTVAYVGSGTSFSDPGLSPANGNWFYTVYSYDGGGICRAYLTASPLQGNTTAVTAEPTAQATSFLTANETENTIDVSWVAASPVPSGYVVLRRAGSAVTDVPADGSTYTAGNTIGSSTVAFVGSGTSFTDSGLSATTTYHYAIFSFNAGACTPEYLTTAPLAGTGTTTAGGSTVRDWNISE